MIFFLLEMINKNNYKFYYFLMKLSFPFKFSESLNENDNHQTIHLMQNILQMNRVLLVIRQILYCH